MVHLTRRDFIKATGYSGAACILSPVLMSTLTQSSRPSAKNPNIVIVISDDQGYGDFGCFGNPIVKTPNLDALYKESARLKNFIVSPICSPTRASLMTGRYNYRTGVWDAWMGRCSINGDEVTIAEQLSKTGYKTGIFGKWHLGENCPQRAMDNGFDESYIIASLERFDPMIDHNGDLKKMKGYVDDIIFDRAMDFIEKNRNQRFLACVPSVLPHDGQDPQVPAEYVEPYKNARGISEGDKEIYAMVTKLDENIGRLMRKLKELGLDKNTAVFFLSDNGPLRLCPELVSEPERVACKRQEIGNRGNRGLRGGKTTVYEGGIKTPCFVRWNGVIKAGRDIEELTAHIDIFPTLMEMCGSPMPAGVKIDGISFWPLLAGMSVQWPDRTIYIQSDRVEVPRMHKDYCARQKRYKLINGTELYDLKTDPGETDNIASKHPEIVRKMREEYEKWFKDVSSERNFEPSYTILGSPTQKDIRFSIWNRHSTGFPVKLENAGPFKVTVDGIQHQLFDDTSRMSIRFGDEVYQKDIDQDKDVLVFENITLQKGFCNFDISPLGYKKPHKMYYGNEDYGYRYITISLVE